MVPPLAILKLEMWKKFWKILKNEAVKLAVLCTIKIFMGEGTGVVDE